MTALSAFDADVLIYAADRDHPLGVGVRRLLEVDDGMGVGSVLLLPEVLARPMRAAPDSDDADALIAVVSRLRLLPVTEPTGRLALLLAVKYRLRAADAVHLATAVEAGAQRFVTNNRKDFPQSIAEIDVEYPEGLDRER